MPGITLMHADGRLKKPSCTAKAGQGFTLIELMVTLVVLGIIAAIATPAFTGLVNANRLTSQSNELIGAIQMARSEAIKRNERVSFCGSTDGAACVAGSATWTQWLVLRDAGGVVLQAGQIRAPLQVNSANPQMTFQADGLARTAAGLLFTGDITVCLPVSRPVENLRRIAVAGGSRTSVSSVANAGACP